MGYRGGKYEALSCKDAGGGRGKEEIRERGEAEKCGSRKERIGKPGISERGKSTPKARVVIGGSGAQRRASRPSRRRGRMVGASGTGAALICSVRANMLF